MCDILVVVDMQRDFVDGALGTPEAVAIVPKVVERVKSFPGKIFFTRDDHPVDYLRGREGRLLPIEHCIRGSEGFRFVPELEELTVGQEIFDKPTFASPELGERLREMNAEEPIGQVTIIGLCTDICVICIAMTLRGFLPEVPIAIDSACVAGVTPETHEIALKALAACQFIIL